MRISETPHFLLFNSDFNPLVMVVDGVTCINSSTYAKASSIGSIMKITIMDEDTDVWRRTIVEEI